MTVQTITTESSSNIALETIPGQASASALNDISVVTINKETFDSDPESRDWLVGTDWVYDDTNHRIKIA